MHSQRIGLTIALLLGVNALILKGELSQALQPPISASILSKTSHSTQADQLFTQGMAQYRTNQFEEAIQSWRKALNLYRSLGNQRQELLTLIRLSVAYLGIGDPQAAIAHAQQSLSLAQELGDTFSQVQALGNLGIAHKALGKYAQALSVYEQALDSIHQLREETGSASNLDAMEAQVLHNLGNVYEVLGQYHQAIEVYQESILLTQDAGNGYTEADALRNIGVVHAELGDYAKAIQFLEQSLAIAQASSDHLGVGYALNNLGAAYHALQKLEQAIAYYQQSLEIARTIQNRQLETDALGSLGLTYKDLGEYEQAIALLEESYAIAQHVGNPQAIGRALNNLGGVLLSAGRLADAEKQLRTAIDALESLRPNLVDTLNLSLFDTHVLTYNLLQQVLIARGKHEAALEISERGRARAFVELLSSRLSSYELFTIGDQTPTLEQIQRIARQQNATMVEYTLVPEEEFMFQGKLRGRAAELYIWVVKSTGEITFRQVDLEVEALPLKDLVKVGRDAIGVRSRGGLELAFPEDSPDIAHLQTLHQLLIEPIADLLPTDPNDLVVFIPQEDLFLVPFPALKAANGQYLIQQHTLLTAPAIQLLDLTQKQWERVTANEKIGSDQASPKPLKGDDLLIVGNPTMPSIWVSREEPSRQLLALPGAEQEALAIAEFFDAQALTQSLATETTLKQRMPQARVIHLATHGLLEYGQPQTSGVQDVPGAIALAPSGEDDGLLTAAEIQQLSLNAELVVLSACDTGLGEITGDGVVGLSRSLFEAGAPSVIVSLWAVPDAPTAALMTEFYQQWQLGLDKAQALRQAMLNTMETHPEPRNWAAFTLLGETE